MSFIKATRVVKTDEPDKPTVLSVLNSAESREGVLSVLKVPKEEEGAYDVEYDLKVYYKVNVKGLTSQGFIAYDVDFWNTKEDHDKGLKPVLRNSFFLQPTGKPTTNYQNLMTSSIEEYLVRASLRGETGDNRDLSHRTSKPVSSASVYNNTGVMAMRNKVVEKI